MARQRCRCVNCMLKIPPCEAAAYGGRICEVCWSVGHLPTKRTRRYIYRGSVPEGHYLPEFEIGFIADAGTGDLPPGAV